MNKRGDFTTKELLSVIVAVIGIALVVYGISKLYGITQDNVSDNVSGILKKISAKVNSLDENESSQLIVQGFTGAESWYLVGFNKEDAPDKCFPGGCLCVCELKGGDSISEGCQEISFCERIDLEEISTVDKTSTYEYVGVDRILVEKDLPYIGLSENLMLFNISRGESSLIVFRDRRNDN